MTIKEFLNQALMQIKLKWSIDTHNHYQIHFNHFIKWSNDNDIFLLDDLTENVIIDYISFMKPTVTNRTINIRIGNLKRAFKYARLETSIFQNISKFQEVKKTFNMIDLKQIRIIRNYAFQLKDDHLNNLMVKAIILLLMDTGVRRKELCHIEKKNVNLTERTIKLTTTKTDEDRIVPFKEKTLPVILKLLDLKTNHKYLIHNKLKNRAITVEDITYVISRKLKRELGIEIHPHMFRHSFASIMLENDAQLKIVMDLMGHKNIETTERYTHISKKRIKETYEKSYKID